MARLRHQRGLRCVIGSSARPDVLDPGCVILHSDALDLGAEVRQAVEHGAPSPVYLGLAAADLAVRMDWLDIVVVRGEAAHDRVRDHR